MNSPSNPLHIAIIPDGNRRWARHRSLFPWNGHEKAMENFRELMEWCRKDKRIGTLTIWCFSTENWKREKKEIDKLMQLFEQYITSERPTLIERQTRFVHSGRKDRLPPSLRSLIEQTEDETRDQTGFTFHIALDYGGQDEIVRAVERLKKADLKTIDESTIRSHLDHPELPDIDLIIRTSGEQRTSNFFLWQSAYAEWIFTDKYFPDFHTHDIAEALEDYDRRKRRFGS